MSRVRDRWAGPKASIAVDAEPEHVSRRRRPRESRIPANDPRGDGQIQMIHSHLIDVFHRAHSLGLTNRSVADMSGTAPCRCRRREIRPQRRWLIASSIGRLSARRQDHGRGPRANNRHAPESRIAGHSIRLRNTRRRALPAGRRGIPPAFDIARSAERQIDDAFRETASDAFSSPITRVDVSHAGDVEGRWPPLPSGTADDRPERSNVDPRAC